MEAEGTDEDLKLILLNLAATTVCKLQKIKVRTWKQLQLRRPIAIRVLSFKVVAEIEQKCLNFFHRQKGSDCLLNGSLLWKKLVCGPKITSFSKQIDDAVLGGFQKGSIYEVVGAPGTGKSQLCYQLACSAFVPESVQGLSAERVVLIDTEASLYKPRLMQVMQQTVSHCKYLQPLLQQNPDFSAEALLHKIEAYRCIRASDLISILSSLLSQSESEPDKYPMDLLIIDSVAAPFRLPDFATVKERCEMLNKMAKLLNQFTIVTDACIVLTNHITTKLVEKSESGPGSAALGSYFVPLLGDFWGTLARKRILLSESAVNREFNVFKTLAEDDVAPVAFQITQGGIRDVCCSNKKR